MRIQQSHGKRKIALAMISIVGISLISGSVFAYSQFTSSNESQSKTAEVKPAKSDDRGISSDQTSNIEKKADPAAPEEIPSSESSTSSSINGPASSTQESNSRTATVPEVAREVVATCNESMKISYTLSRDSKESAENAKWGQQVNAIHSEAARRGMSFSGYAQEQISLIKPAHDATLASIESEYISNLASINCL